MNSPATTVTQTRPIKPTKSPIAERTSLISHHIKTSQFPSAVAEFTRMRLDGIDPNHATFATLLSGCGKSRSDDPQLGRSLHGYTARIGLDKGNVKVGTALIGFYGRIGDVGCARKVFDGMRVRNSVTWDVMVDGCLRNGMVEDALELFEGMPETERRGVVSWTGLIWGLVKMGLDEDALGVFREMQRLGVGMDYVTVLGVLAGCASLGSFELAMWTHRLVLEMGLEGNLKVCNSLVDVYFRCGCVDFARSVFKGMGRRNVVSWNSMITGFALNGCAVEAFRYFDMMREDGFEPNGVTFTGVLTACSHGGLVDEGLRLFETMKRDYRIKPTIEHFGCIVDLYTRAGRLKDAIDVIMNMPMRPNEVVLGSLLSSCASQGNVQVAESLIKHLIRTNRGGDSNQVLLSNMYAALGKWDMASKTRRKMKALGIRKKPGLSTIEIGCTCHEFVAGDKRHVDTEKIYGILELLSIELEICGYVPSTIVTDLLYDD